MPNENTTIDPRAHEKRKLLILKISVGVMAVILVFLWAFAARNRFVNFAKTDTSSAKIINNMQKQWGDAVQVIDAGAGKPNTNEQTQAEEKVRQTLTNIIITAASSTKVEAVRATTTSSTVEQ